MATSTGPGTPKRCSIFASGSAYLFSIDLPLRDHARAGVTGGRRKRRRAPERSADPVIVSLHGRIVGDAAECGVDHFARDAVVDRDLLEGFEPIVESFGACAAFGGARADAAPKTAAITAAKTSSFKSLPRIGSSSFNTNRWGRARLGRREAEYTLAHTFGLATDKGEANTQPTRICPMSPPTQLRSLSHPHSASFTASKPLSASTGSQ